VEGLAQRYAVPELGALWPGNGKISHAVPA
jgi:hypothetical protein